MKFLSLDSIKETLIVYPVSILISLIATYFELTSKGGNISTFVFLFIFMTAWELNIAKQNQSTKSFVVTTLKNAFIAFIFGVLIDRCVFSGNADYQNFIWLICPIFLLLLTISFLSDKKTYQMGFIFATIIAGLCVLTLCLWIVSFFKSLDYLCGTLFYRGVYLNLAGIQFYFVFPMLILIMGPKNLELDLKEISKKPVTFYLFVLVSLLSLSFIILYVDGFTFFRMLIFVSIVSLIVMTLQILCRFYVSFRGCLVGFMLPFIITLDFYSVKSPLSFKTLISNSQWLELKKVLTDFGFYKDGVIHPLSQHMQQKDQYRLISLITQIFSTGSESVLYENFPKKVFLSDKPRLNEILEYLKISILQWSEIKTMLTDFGFYKDGVIGPSSKSISRENQEKLRSWIVHLFFEDYVLFSSIFPKNLGFSSLDDMLEYLKLEEKILDKSIIR